ncbi:MAG: DNA polymerase Y family protein [Pseudomonadota bacterium]
MLWIALHLPLLSLESFAATLPHAAGEQPLALADAHTILAVNAAARALGVQPGFKRATALALAPQLTLGLADPIRDTQALTAVAHAALAFTPTVVIQPPSDAASTTAPGAAPHTVLLEVRASLRYFGGLPALQQRLKDALAPLGHRLHIVSASTPLGAALLARVNARLDCADLAATARALACAPVWLLGPGRAHWEALQGMGLHTIADLKRVPRDGLARRFGPVVLDELDRATGQRPDPRVPLALPPMFDSRLELFARADTTEQLMHGAAVLLARLVAWLSAQHAFVRRFTLVMEHEQRSRRDAPGSGITTLEVALAEPSRDSAHLGVLLRERLAQLHLPAPTLDLRLHAEDNARRAPPNTELFPTPAAEHEGLTRLIERLQARLGREQVQRLVPVPDHRPERATGWRTADAQMRPARARSAAASAHEPANAARLVRPVWLFQQPESLHEREMASGERGPWCEGQPLLLLSGPERIESGWWDFDAVERDYYIAQLPEGALVWIFRERVPVAGANLAWFLQGRFG